MILPFWQKGQLATIHFYKRKHFVKVNIDGSVLSHFERTRGDKNQIFRTYGSALRPQRSCLPSLTYIPNIRYLDQILLKTGQYCITFYLVPIREYYQHSFVLPQHFLPNTVFPHDVSPETILF